MLIARIEESAGGREIESLRPKGGARRCTYFQDEICLAPRLRFETCRSCARVSPRAALSIFFDRIMGLARQLIKGQASGL